VPIETFLDQMWPDAEGDAALNAFKTTLSRLRKVGSPEGEDGEWITVHHKKISLNMELCRVDCCCFVGDLAAGVGEESVEKLAKALDMYADDFLPDDIGIHSIERQRSRLRDEFVGAALRTGATLYEGGFSGKGDPLS
jgi:LuxR family transcriptional regulator, maltose regulon positive regulatory protein